MTDSGESRTARDRAAEAVFYAQWGYYGHRWEDAQAGTDNLSLATGDLGIVTASYKIADAVLSALACRSPMGHRYKHDCGCACRLIEGHRGRHQCEVALLSVDSGEVDT